MRGKFNRLKNRLDRNLSDNAVTRYVTFSALYAAQGIPEGITYFALPAWLAMNGKSPMEIAALVSVMLIPWSFKILIAPLMDRFTFLSMGRKRPWVIFGQIGLILSFLNLGLVPDPMNNLNGLMIAGFLVNFFGAFQDVATDGMAVEVIPRKEQARANGLMWGSKTIGLSLSLIIGTWLINNFGFSFAVFSLSLAVAGIMIFPIIFKERAGEKLLPWTPGKASLVSKKTQLKSWTHIFKSLYRVVILKSSLILCIGIFILGIMYGLVDTLLPIFSIQELGWTNSYFSNILSTTNVIGGFLGMFIGGYLVDYFGKIKMLTIYLILLTILIGVFAFITNLWSSAIIMIAFILCYCTLYTFLCIAVFASAMHLCWKTVAATQFTLYMALSNMGRAAGASLLGILKTSFNWETVFLTIAVIPFILIIIIQFINLKRHRIIVNSFDVLPVKVSTPPIIKNKEYS
ncbi:PAT family beta-lactamase induction signal transducer AmpG [Christiangramia gaetbulicola]|uniref:PAT family beta-lactamase induction signal transducer AmpG n=1 Tax=Christiangramia gaetbulicola TaxID=703340 RepID=A0A2T6AED1_9FLAO|nr:MFS transporter [Christiangramia gaetbulicola]PTX42170.1 PAT family beta-lactamase induction signal transducer AmpG [Christiangramia gaetbulicola]